MDQNTKQSLSQVNKYEKQMDYMFVTIRKIKTNLLLYAFTEPQKNFTLHFSKLFL